MRILILEEALESGSGHWPVYLGDIARGLRQEGDTIHLLAHRRTDPALLQCLEAVPWLSRSCWSDPSTQGPLGGIRHALRFARELRRWFRQQSDSYDWICSLTMRLPHLLAYTLLVRAGLIPEGSRCLLLFVQGFGVYAGPDQPVRFPQTPSNRLARWCFRRLQGPVNQGQIVLAAETAAMQRELASFSGLPVVLFPHPVVSKQDGCISSCSAQTTPRSQSITITCPGFARYEKGNDLLLDAMRLVWAQPGLENAHFVCQWPEPFAMPDGRLLSPDPELLEDTRLELLNYNLGPNEYQNLLMRSDLIVLPYRLASYHNRVSRVAIEASIYGVPILPMRGTWAYELNQWAGGSLVIDQETVECVAQGLVEAIRHLDCNRYVAGQNAHRVAHLHSASNFRATLLAM